jgi:hypothetical protein
MLGFFVVIGTAGGFLASAVNTVEKGARTIAHIIMKAKKIRLLLKNCIDTIFPPPSNLVWFFLLR